MVDQAEIEITTSRLRQHHQLHVRFKLPKINDDVIKLKFFPRYWPFVQGIHRWPVNSPRKGQWRGALLFLWYVPWINGWANNRGAGDLRRHRAHYDVAVMLCKKPSSNGEVESALDNWKSIWNKRVLISTSNCVLILKRILALAIDMHICRFNFDALIQKDAVNPERNQEIIVGQEGIELTTMK